MDLEGALKNLDQCSGLNKKRLRRLAGKARVVRYAAGHQIVTRGRSGSQGGMGIVGVVLSGSLELVDVDGEVLGHVGPGQSFGDTSPGDGRARSLTLIAAEPTEAAILSAWDVRNELQSRTRAGVRSLLPRSAAGVILAAACVLAFLAFAPVPGLVQTRDFVGRFASQLLTLGPGFGSSKSHVATVNGIHLTHADWIALEPRWIALDPSGDLYVAETADQRIAKLSPSGKLLARWGLGGSGLPQVDNPEGLATDARGNLYVANDNHVLKLAPSGKVLAMWGATGQKPGQLVNPEGIAVDEAGDIYVADAGNNRIQKLSPSGKTLAAWGTLGSERGQFDFPKGVAVDRQGNVYVLESRTSAGGSIDRIQELSPRGSWLGEWRGGESGGGQFDQPTGIAVDRAGNLYLAATHGFSDGIIQKRSPSGKLLAQWETNENLPVALAVDARGDVYAMETNSDRTRLVKLSPRGELLAVWQ